MFAFVTLAAFVATTALSIDCALTTCNALDRTISLQPHGPSFRCDRTDLTFVEYRICANPKLAKLDLELSDAYGEDAMTSLSARTVVAREAAWKIERARCRRNACIEHTYRRRLTELREDATATVARSYSRRTPIPLATSAAFVARLGRKAGRTCFAIDGTIDLGDGRRSILAHACDGCSPHSEDVVFHPEASAYRLIFRAPDCYLRGTFEGLQLHRSHGLREIETRTHVGMGYDENMLYDYDGRAYHRTVTVREKYTRGLAHMQITLIR